MTGAGHISAIVLARDEVYDVVPCLRTLRWAGERVVVFDARGDAEIARRADAEGARVVARRFDNWAGQRNFALQQASRPWALFVDVDERVTPDLASEMSRRVEEAERRGTPVGFWLPRQNLILGQWVRHAGWSPDAQLRLFRRDRGHYDPARLVHELVQLNGPADQLLCRLVHHNYTSWPQFWSKQVRYARTDALAQYRRGVRAKPQNFVLQPLRELRRRYVALEGHRDGLLGLQLSLVLALATFVTYCELARLQIAGSGRRPA